MSRRDLLSETTVHAAFAGIVLLTLLAALGPLATDDLWWHLSLGRLYAESGPWLDGDPRLHSAAGAPHPNAWLFDLALYGMERLAGLNALRGVHAGLVGVILLVAWRLLRRVSGSRLVASLGSGAFAVLAMYRLLQLRPSLATILITLLLLGRIFELRERRAPRRALAACALCALWANLHPGFVLGPVLFGVAAGGCLVVPLVTDPSRAKELRGPAARLALTGLLALVATGFNPDAFGAHANYLGAGAESAAEAFVVDEWKAFPAFALPLSNVPPTPAAWAGFWLLLLATPAAALHASLRRGPRPGRITGRAMDDDDRTTTTTPRARRPDPVLLALAGPGLLAPFLAIRFLWLAILPLLLLASMAGDGEAEQHASRRGGKWMAAIAALALLAAVPTASAWRILSPRLERAAYGDAYDADRYYAHAVWFLADTGVEGRLYHPYFMGGFLEYWLGPRLRMMVDGSLNFPHATLEDYSRIQTFSPDEDGGDPRRLLDRHGIDFFVGVGLPIEPRPGRPWRYTTTHLARSTDWMLVYRGLRSAVYMRRAPRNEANLDRIADWYARAGVPFDRQQGIDVRSVLDRSTGWAIENGMAPIDYPQLVAAAERARPRMRAIARDRLAWTWAALGLYAQALDLDASVATEPSASRRAFENARHRRRIWCLLALDRRQDLLDAAEALESDASATAASPGVDAETALVATARRYAGIEDPLERDRLAATWTPLSSVEGGQIRRVERSAPARRSRVDGPDHSGSQWNRSPSPAR